MQLSPNQKIFAEFFSAFPSFTYNFEYFEKGMSLIDCLFLKLYTANNGFT